MRAVGLDWGEKRIGVALSNSEGTVATPFGTIEVTNDKHQMWKRLHDVLDESEAEIIVVGYPKSLSGGNNASTAKVESWVEDLKAHIAIPVVMCDERLTTREAHRELAEAGLSEKQRRNVVDQVAASIMLQGWLDSQTS